MGKRTPDYHVPKPALRPPGRGGFITDETNAGPDPHAVPMQDALSFIELLEHPACLIDSNGAIVGLSPGWRAFAPAMVGGGSSLPWTQLIYREDRYEAFSRFHAVSTKKTHSRLECRLATAHGSYRWFVLQIQCWTGQAQPALYLCTGMDIHDIRQREDALHRLASIQTDMLDVSVDCIKLIALDGTLTHLNKAGCRALGVTRDSSFGMPWLPLLPADVREAGEQALRFARQGEFSRFPGRSEIPGEKPQYWDNMLTPVLGGDGTPTAILCVSREITSEQEALRSLKASEQRLAIAARVGGLGIWDYDIVADAWHGDAAWYQIMGMDEDVPITSLAQCKALIHPGDVDEVMKALRSWSEPHDASSDYGIVFRIVRPNGDVRWVRSGAHLQYEKGVPQRAVGFVVDITDAWRGEMALRDANRLLEAERSSLARQCLEDPLTGLSNRRFLDSELAHLCLLAQEKKAAFCVGMIDIDHFKAFNDRYGHLEGDRALKAVASTIQDAMRQTDFVARFGGEEFAFLMPGTDDPAHVLERLFQAIEALRIVHADSPTGYVTISCGCIVMKDVGHRSPQQILQLSDDVLYAVKASGRNHFVIGHIDS